MTPHVINKLPLFLVLDSQNLNVLKRCELPKRYVEDASVFSSPDNLSLFICLCLKVTNIKEAEAIGLCMQKLLQPFPSYG